ncbi:hypothetical protein WAQ86_004732 [Salmonella enterica]
MKRVLIVLAAVCACALSIYLFVISSLGSVAPEQKPDRAIMSEPQSNQAKPDDGPKTFKRGEFHNTGRDVGY